MSSGELYFSSAPTNGFTPRSCPTTALYLFVAAPNILVKLALNELVVWSPVDIGTKAMGDREGRTWLQLVNVGRTPHTRCINIVRNTNNRGNVFWISVLSANGYAVGPLARARGTYNLDLDLKWKSKCIFAWLRLSGGNEKAIEPITKLANIVMAKVQTSRIVCQCQ
jgi:hypothetical protein